jgi:DNA processing protein
LNYYKKYGKLFLISNNGGIEMEEREYYYALCNTYGLGAVTIKKLIDYFGTVEEIWNAKEKSLGVVLTPKQCRAFLQHKRQIGKTMEGYYKLKDYGIRFVIPTDEEYPMRLKEIYDYPQGLYVKGELPKSEHAVAIIGARDCSHYGSEIATDLALELAQLGVDVISGLALGIDTCGHVGALQGGGLTYAVLGCGIDICYPTQNLNLYQEIIEHGGVLSEYPLGTPPIAMNFPMRNRIISGLVDSIIVVEAKQKSGSLITANLALEQGREVFAVPGRITDYRSQGCNALLKEGANLLGDISDIVNFLFKNYNISNKNEKNAKLGLALEEEKVYSVLGLHSTSVATIIEQTDYALAEVMDILIRLEEKGLVVQTATNYYARTYKCMEN